MSGPESKVEGYLKAELERYGFKVIKFVPQGFAGAPDRWIFRPTWSPGEPMALEVKAKGEVPRKLQLAAMADLKSRGVKVIPFVDSKAGVDALVIKLVGEAVWYCKPADRADFPSHVLAAWQEYNRIYGLNAY